MKEITLKLYDINELKENFPKAFEKAYSDYQANSDYFYANDNQKTLNNFAEVFGIKIKNYEYDQFSGFVSFELPSNGLEFLEGVRLYKFLINNYLEEINNPEKLTGYYLDYDIFKPLQDFIKKPINITAKGLFQRCFDSWVRACKDDIKEQNSLEYFVEHCQANEWHFEQSGKLRNDLLT